MGHTQGLPTVATDLDAAAAGNGLTIAFNSSTIATAGSIGPSGTVNITVSTKMSGVADPGVTVYLCECLESANIADGVPGDFTAVPAAQCSGATQLPANGTLLTCVTNSTGKLIMTYNAPATPPAQGRADWVGQLTNSPTTKTKAQTHYVYTTVFRFGPSPIAAPGSLHAGANVPITLSSEDGLDQGISGATAYLSFTGAGSASVGGTALTKSLQLFTANANGTFQITYTAPSPLPSSGTDTITVQDLNKSPQEVNTDTYAFASSTPVISIGDVDVYEGDQNPGTPADFTVTISPVQSTATTVDYVTLCGVGDKGCGEDFKQVFTPVAVTIPANTATTTVLVRQFAYLGGKSDDGVGGETYNEGWYVLLSNPSTGILGRSMGEGILLPDVEGSTVPLAYLYTGNASVVPGPGSGCRQGRHVLHRDTRGHRELDSHLQLHDQQRHGDRRDRLHGYLRSRIHRRREDELRHQGRAAAERATEQQQDLHRDDQQRQWRPDHQPCDRHRDGAVELARQVDRQPAIVSVLQPSAPSQTCESNQTVQSFQQGPGRSRER